MNGSVGPTGWRMIEASVENCKAILSQSVFRCAEQTRAILFSGKLPPNVSIKVGCSPRVSPTVVYLSPGCGSWADDMVEALGGRPCAEPDHDCVAWEYGFEIR